MIHDPVATAPEAEQHALASRIPGLEGARIGLFNNGKPAAEPVLQVIDERLGETYPSASTETYTVDHLNQLKNDAELSAIESWASEVDVCIGALGDCGSCTKFLVYAMNAVEAGDTPAVGLVDEGFSIDWRSNAADLGRELRFFGLPGVAEVTDTERIRGELTPSAFEDIVGELTSPNA